MPASLDERQESETQIPVSFLDVIRRLEWRAELLSIAIILAEVSIVWIAFGLIMAGTESRDAYPYWIIAFVMLSAHYVIHLLDRARVWSPDYEIIMSVSVAVTLLVAVKAASFPGIAIYDPHWIVEAVNGLAFFDTEQVRPVWGNVVLVIYVWFRGRSREEPSLDSAYSMFRWGTLALGIILTLILIGAPDDLEIRGSLSLGTLLFFGCSLAAIGFARMRLESVRSTTPLGPRWLATFATPVLAILLAAVFAAGIFSRSFLETVVWVLSPVFFVLGVIFQIIVLAIAIIAFLILTPIFWLIGDVEPETVSPTATVVGDLGPTALEQPPNETFTIPEPLQYLIAAIVLVIIVTILTRYLFRRRARKRPDAIEERESVMEWGNLFGSLGDQLRSLFSRDSEPDPYGALRGDDRWRHTITVRERYRNLQERGADMGRARSHRETAEEYRPVVASKFGSVVRPTVDGMTATYRRVRYSGVPASEQDADQMNKGWDELKDSPGNEPAD